jgi:hypothetical protein
MTREFKKIEDLPKKPNWKDKEEVKAIQEFFRKEFESQGMLNKPIGLTWDQIGIKRKQK